MAKKIVVARVEVLSGKENDFLNLTSPLIKASNSEEGCLIYTLYQSPHKSTDFIFYEEYKDDTALKTHGESKHFQEFAANVGSLLAKELDIQTF